MATKNKEISKPLQGKYFEAVGRRKTSVARVRVFSAKPDEAGIFVNEKPADEYFKTLEQRKIVGDALQTLKLEGKYRISVKINGGGAHSQSEALRHGISRAFLKIEPEWRKSLKMEGFLKRDPREKERRKFGLKKARKAPQWAKR